MTNATVCMETYYSNALPSAPIFSQYYGKNINFYIFFLILVKLKAKETVYLKYFRRLIINLLQKKHKFLAIKREPLKNV